MKGASALAGLLRTAPYAVAVAAPRAHADEVAAGLACREPSLTIRTRSGQACARTWSTTQDGHGMPTVGNIEVVDLVEENYDGQAKRNGPAPYSAADRKHLVRHHRRPIASRAVWTASGVRSLTDTTPQVSCASKRRIVTSQSVCVPSDSRVNSSLCR